MFTYISTLRAYSTITDLAVLTTFASYGIRVVNPINPLDSADSIKATVNKLKDHPAILMWALGNEWNYNGLYASKPVSECIALIENAAKAIKSVDSKHPVSTIYGEIPSSSTVAALPSVDAWGLNMWVSHIYHAFRNL